MACRRSGVRIPLPPPKSLRPGQLIGPLALSGAPPAAMHALCVDPARKSRRIHTKGMHGRRRRGLMRAEPGPWLGAGGDGERKRPGRRCSAVFGTFREAVRDPARRSRDFMANSRAFVAISPQSREIVPRTPQLRRAGRAGRAGGAWRRVRGWSRARSCGRGRGPSRLRRAWAGDAPRSGSIGVRGPGFAKVSSCSNGTSWTRESTSFGGMAQLVARLHGMQKVRGSNPLTSTKESKRPGPSKDRASCFCWPFQG
jgi:hypothetical protein